MEHAQAASAATVAAKLTTAWVLFLTSTLVPALQVVALCLTIVFTAFQIVKLVRDLKRQHEGDQDAEARADAAADRRALARLSKDSTL